MVPEVRPSVSDQLTVHEIFSSIQGETSESGRPCTFVRLTGCDLRCSWCDTEYAFTGGGKMSVGEIVAAVEAKGLPFVTVTGGEPLLQSGAFSLVEALLDAGLEVQVETGGHRPVRGLDPRARIILDWKAPGSGESERMHGENLAQLREGDQVKLVLASREDYEWALALLQGPLADIPAQVLVQAVTGGEMQPAELAGWVVDDRLDVRFCLQLHQILWPGQRGV
jgi:7-carboxy-7-deazaguanine synthase